MKPTPRPRGLSMWDRQKLEARERTAASAADNQARENGPLVMGDRGQDSQVQRRYRSGFLQERKRAFEIQLYELIAVAVVAFCLFCCGPAVTAWYFLEWWK